VARAEAAGQRPTADEVEARLRKLSELSASAPPWPHLIDMSAEAITSRLRECAEISALALHLAQAGEAARARCSKGTGTAV
jgi:hypothetical protein